MNHKPNSSFISMVESLFLAFEAEKAGERIDMRNHLETASEHFHYAVEEELDRIETHKQRMRMYDE